MWNAAISQAQCDQISEMIAICKIQNGFYVYINEKLEWYILQNKVYKDNHWNLNVKFVNTPFLTIFYNFVNTDNC